MYVHVHVDDTWTSGTLLGDNILVMFTRILSRCMMLLHENAGIWASFQF